MNITRIPPFHLIPLSLPISLSFLISLSLLAACHRTPPSSPDLSLNPTNYELLSITWSGPSPTAAAAGVAPSFGQAVYFTYDNNHLLTDYRLLNWGGDSLPSPGPPIRTSINIIWNIPTGRSPNAITS